MKERDPGHRYELLTLDNTHGRMHQELQFVKRCGEKYPGNENEYPGTNLQSVLRACYARVEFLQHQHWCAENMNILTNLNGCIYMLEVRAARQHGRPYLHDADFARTAPMCPQCGHTDCEHST